MTHLQPHLGDSRHHELRSFPFWPTPLFQSQLVKDREEFLLKKGTPKDTQGFGPYQNKPFHGPHNKKRDSYRKCPYGRQSTPSSNRSRLQRSFSTSSGWGRLNPSSQWLLKSLPKSTSRRFPSFFQKRLAKKPMLKQCVKHYHQWLNATIHLKTKISQSFPDSLRLQGPSKRSSSGHLFPVSSIRECNRKGGKCKIFHVLQ